MKTEKMTAHSGTYYRHGNPATTNCQIHKYISIMCYTWVAEQHKPRLLL